MMISDLFVLSCKQVWRHPVRSVLTIAGVALGMFLFTAVETMQQALHTAISGRAGDTTLIVYRENRFCPFTSMLPEYYQQNIAEIPGVKHVTPIKVVVNNCGTSLDVVTFRGLPSEDFERFAAKNIKINEGSLENWQRRSDAALIGEILARRRGLSVGDRFDAAGVTATVAGIISSQQAADQDVAYVHLDFLQRQARGGLGVVTQFNVQVDSHEQLESVAAAIDQAFDHAEEPTHTRPQNAFIAQTAKDLVALIGFTRWIGLGAVIAVLALVCNTVLLSIRSRVTEHAILQTLGFDDSALMCMVLIEGLLFGIAGAICGVGLAAGMLHYGGWSIASEGIALVFTPSWSLLGKSILAGIGLGLLAALIPALQARHQPIVSNLRMH